MEPALPSFILGYHGCDLAVADRVCAGAAVLQSSRNDYDWLGEGIYFWEHNAKRAMDFAIEMANRPHPSGQRIKTPAVVGAVINLGLCLNLLDSRFIQMVRSAFEELRGAVDAMGKALPANSGGPDRVSRKLDCAVITTLHERRRSEGHPAFDTVRAAFFKGARCIPMPGSPRRITFRSVSAIHGASWGTSGLWTSQVNRSGDSFEQIKSTPHR